MNVVRMLRDCEKRIAQLYAEELRGRSGVTTVQRLVLTVVADHSGIDQTAIVRKTGVDRSTLGQIVQLLKSQGLLFQSRDPEDKRKCVVTISPAGRKELKIAHRAAQNAEQLFLNEMPKAVRGHFLEGLAKATEAKADV